MDAPPIDLRNQLAEAGQDHVFAGWAGLDAAQREALVQQLRGLRLVELSQLFSQRSATFELPAVDRLSPLPNILPERADPAAIETGESAIRSGQVAVLVVAGGQGSRLGFDKPKGLYPITPLTGRSLFQIHAEKVLAISRRYGARLPFLVMTSDATHQETVRYFEHNQYFGLPESGVSFFQQGTMPALELATGRLLMDGPGRLFSSPNGHGGTLTALADTGLLDKLLAKGVRNLFYFQVDNPLVKIADPAFLGRHVAIRSDVSSKVIPKLGPTDKLGNFVLVDGRLSMIEYSDLPRELAEATDDAGQLRINAGNPAIHVFDLEFLKRVTAHAASDMPYHLAKKKVPYWDFDRRAIVEPQTENALKFERFIFDVLPQAERWMAMWTSRAEEFAPLKNGSGADSPDSVKKAQSDLFAGWLRKAGATVDDHAVVEIGPLVALDPDDLRSRVGPGVMFRGSVVIR